MENNKSHQDDAADFEVQLKKLEKSFDNDNIVLNKDPIQIQNNSKSQIREDFDLQLKNLEKTLYEDNVIVSNLFTKTPQKNFKTNINCHNPKIYHENISNNSQIKPKQDLESQLYPNKLSAAEKFKNIANRFTESRENTKTKKKKGFHQDIDLQLQQLEENLHGCTDVFSKQVQQLTKTYGNPHETEENSQDVSIIAPLNNDLTKALERALEGDDLNLLNIEVDEDGEPPLNQDLKDFLAQELENNITKIPMQPINSTKTNTNKVDKIAGVNVKEHTDKTTLLNENSHSRYAHTNLKSRNMRHTFLNGTKHTTQEGPGQNMKNPSTILNLKSSDGKQYPLKTNDELNIQQQQQQSHLKTLIKSSENQENSVLRTKQGKPSMKEDLENFTPDVIRKIKKEKFTPHQSFINTERGDRTPLPMDELFLKQSPKTQEKRESYEENFTPKRGERTPKTKENVFLKLSSKTQEKNEEVSHNTTPKSCNKTPKRREQQSQEKTEFTMRNKIVKTPGKLNTSPKIDQKLLKNCKVKSTRISPSKVSLLKHSKQNTQLTPATTPQRVRSLAIKLQRLTPEKLIRKAFSDENGQLQILQPPQSPTNVKKNEKTPNKTPRNSEHETPNKAFSEFKLPNGITITRISPSNSKHNFKSNINQSLLNETPIKTSYCKQNFSESSLKSQQQHVIQNVDTNNIQHSPINSQNQITNFLKTENSSSTLRQRKTSIDIVPSMPKTQSYSSTKCTPRHTNLHYKSYAVNRSARKKEVLQRMRHIKKQIFKSIENSQELIQIKRTTKSSPNKPQRKQKLHIENVQILPKLKQELLTPQINTFDNFKKPFAHNIATAHISPKNLNDDEKQAKKSLHTPAINSPINDDEKLIKKSLKRPATSPLLDDVNKTKRLHKSPSNLEDTQLGLSETVTTQYLQCDLGTNRLNVESKAEKTNDNNILDELLHQVDNEQTTNEETDVEKKEIASEETSKTIRIINDFDEIKDLNLLNNFGLKIIKSPDIEDLITFEESEEMKDKAKKFANIYKSWQRIWSSKNGENPKIRQELEISFQQLLTQTNLAFKLDLNVNDLKRLVNLITSWYVQNFNSKLIEKKKISEATNCYLQLFHYIPKTVKRFYYCEYCEEYFTTEHRYLTHRIVHTGAVYPYQCMKCTMGFRLIKPYKVHEMQCSALLYEHSKTHLKTSYNCAKCALVFTSAVDAQKHTTVCNRNVRIRKQLTPRPPKLKEK